MKKQLIFKVSLFVLISIFLSACSGLKTKDFTAQKYTNFKKGNTDVAINKTVVEKQLQQAFTMPVKTADAQEVNATHTIASNNIIPALNVPLYQTEKNTTTKNVAPFKVKETFKGVKKENVLPYIAQKLYEKPNTAAVQFNSDVELLLMVIIAIILPPVAVLIARGFGGAFLLNIILTILFILPGVIHALLIVFDAI